MAQQNFYVGRLAIDYTGRRISIDGAGTSLTSDRVLLIDVADADRTLSFAGNLTLAGALTTSGAFATTFTMTGATNVTFPTSGTLASSGSNSFTGNQSINAAGSTTSASLSFGGSTNNWITFGQTGVAAPAFTTRSVGTKLVLYSNVTSTTGDFALGIESGNMWFSTDQTTTGFKWYGGTTLAATLTGTGALTLVGNLTVSNGNILRDSGGPFVFTRAGSYAGLALTDTSGASYSRWTATATMLHLWTNSSGGTSYAGISTGGRFLINTVTDDGTNQLQVNGGANISGTITTTALSAGVSAPGLLGSSNNSVAAGGSNQAGATALTSDVNIVVSSTAGTAFGVVIPGATAGKYVVVVNRSANAISVYPSAGHTIDGGSPNVPISLPVGAFAELYGSSSSAWYSTLNATITGTYVVGNITGAAGSVTNAATFNNSGSGAASGTTFNGSAAQTISYNTIGAAATGGANATGTWPISVTGTASNVSGVVAVANGGTNATTAPAARTSLGATAFTRSATAPTSPNPGDIWLNTADGVEYTYYDDGDSTQWVDLGNSAVVAIQQAIPTYIGSVQPTDLTQYFWIQTGVGTGGTGITMWVNT